MKTTKYFGMLAVAGCMATSAQAATTWGVGAFLDGANAGTAQAVSATAWATTGAGTPATLQSACIHNYGSNGYGIVNLQEANPCTGEPGTGPHAADNNGATDLFLLQFASAVTLTSVKIGWNGTDNFSADSDLSVLAYTGSTPPTPSMSGKTLGTGTGGLLSNGWSVVGNFANVGATASNEATISTATSSSWWIVSAYNSAFGSGTNLGMGAQDYFKLLSVAGNVKPSAWKYYQTQPSPTSAYSPRNGVLQFTISISERFSGLPRFCKSALRPVHRLPRKSRAHRSLRPWPVPTQSVLR